MPTIRYIKYVEELMTTTIFIFVITLYYLGGTVLGLFTNPCHWSN